MSSFPVMLFDVDHTLFDFDGSERASFDHALSACGVDRSPGDYAAYDAINRALWRRLERGEIGAAEVRWRRFEEFLAAIGSNADAVEVADVFADGLRRLGELYPGTAEVLTALRDRGVRLGVVSNGFGDVQRSKLERLGIAALFETVIVSGEVGAAKPDRRIFDAAREALGWVEPDTVLMIGDNLITDIGGGAAAGMTTCWFNPSGATLGRDTPRPNYTISRLEALLTMPHRDVTESVRNQPNAHDQGGRDRLTATQSTSGGVLGG